MEGDDKHAILTKSCRIVESPIKTVRECCGGGKLNACLIVSKWAVKYSDPSSACIWDLLVIWKQLYLLHSNGQLRFRYIRAGTLVGPLTKTPFTDATAAKQTIANHIAKC